MTKAAPIFDSDEEALAAAVDAYEAYLSISSTIAADGGKNPERIRAVASPAYGDQLVDGFKGLSDNGLRTEGSSEFDSSSLVNWTQVNSGVRVTIYLCRDVSPVRVIASDNTDVTPRDREERIPLVLTFVSSPVPAHLLIDSSELWTGRDFC